jgi:hypothetical protein
MKQETKREKRRRKRRREKAEERLVVATEMKLLRGKRAVITKWSVSSKDTIKNMNGDIVDVVPGAMLDY